ncbi:long-chain acyl-CoA synthetase [Mucilaginibacter gracilis]|uniref:Long-chain acyl-CoA synthetase n=1 Tax=Mucilaginibacter gracilis TaxID=423350 RepID=A0A495IYB1_9SPHI|nr:long-chain fatty acid--CoA ligase [Mucilaginibacter gracilis]RKR81690.1 long-chain acyl-CoA synthetase [Mucilaginibacter gracilis]
MSITRVFDLLQYNLEKFPKADMLAHKAEGGWTKYASQQVIDTINQVSYGLLQLGIKKDDKVAIMSPNRPEWNFCDFGIMQIGATQVPMYPTLSDADIEFILKDAEVKMIFVSDKEIYGKIIAIKDKVAPQLIIYTYEKVNGAKHWSEVLQLGSEHQEPDLQQYRDKIQPDDLLTLIYTSGTTGTPKGVMLTHGNLVSNVLESSKLYPQEIKRALSFLPMSHIFERMVIYMYVYLGISIYYAQSMDTIVADMQDVKPHCFTTVPRLLEKVYDRIVAKGAELTGAKKAIFYWALDLGLKYELDGANGFWYELKLKIARKLVFSKWREALGGEIIAIVSGGAALQPRLARVFWAAEIKILEGYGLTETSPVITVNFPMQGGTKFGTVGPILKGVTIKIAEDGEIMVKGPNVMKGYYKREDATSEAIDADGYFHTGDIGELVDNTYLRITDRKKEIFKTAGGKYIAPQTLENKFKESPLIEQIIVIGENERFPAALILPAFDALKDWCAKKGITFTTNQEIIKNQQVVEKYKREIERYNVGFGHWEQVKKFELIADEWSINTGEMTPKLSLKRKVILKKYDKLVQKIYQSVQAHA